MKRKKKEPLPPPPCVGCFKPSEGSLRIIFGTKQGWRDDDEFLFEAPYCRTCLSAHVTIAVKMYQPDPTDERYTKEARK